jgi:hypothetical protein
VFWNVQKSLIIFILPCIAATKSTKSTMVTPSNAAKMAKKAPSKKKAAVVDGAVAVVEKVAVVATHRPRERTGRGSNAHARACLQRMIQNENAAVAMVVDEAMARATKEEPAAVVKARGVLDLAVRGAVALPTRESSAAMNAAVGIFHASTGHHYRGSPHTLERRKARRAAKLIEQRIKVRPPQVQRLADSRAARISELLLNDRSARHAAETASHAAVAATCAAVNSGKLLRAAQGIDETITSQEAALARQAESALRILRERATRNDVVAEAVVGAVVADAVVDDAVVDDAVGGAGGEADEAASDE